MKYLRVRNWNKFQHYKKDEPAAWIKLHTKLLADYEFNLLSHQTQLTLIKLWLLSAQLGNKLPHDHVWLKKQVSARTVDLDLLISRGFLEEVYSDSRETLVSEEKRREEKKRVTPKPPVDNFRKPDTIKSSYCVDCDRRLAPGVSLEDHKRLTHPEAA